MQLLDEALIAVRQRLSHRYIPARQLPDKAVSLIDTASARVAVSQHAVPAEVEDSRRRIEALETEAEIIEREGAVGIDVTAREKLARIEASLTEERARCEELEARWEKEKGLVDRDPRDPRQAARPRASCSTRCPTPRRRRGPARPSGVVTAR